MNKDHWTTTKSDIPLQKTARIVQKIDDKKTDKLTDCWTSWH